MVAFRAVPTVALAPILVVWFGVGLLSKSLLAFVTAMVPIVINTVIGMSRTPARVNQDDAIEGEVIAVRHARRDQREVQGG